MWVETTKLFLEWSFVHKCNVAIDLQASAPTVTYNSLGIKGKMMTQF